MSTWPVIAPSPATGSGPPVLADYEAELASFSWSDEIARFTAEAGDGAGGVNMAYVAVDRHVAAGDGDQTAIISVGRHGERRQLSYAELAEQTNRFASFLQRWGVRPGDRVFSLLGRPLELYVAALGTLKTAAVFSPLFSAFGPEPVRERMRLGNAKVLVTTPTLYKRRVEPVRDQLPDLETVVLVAGTTDGSALSFEDALAAGSSEFTVPATPLETPALLHFTSGTTGKPKGAVHVHGAVVAHQATARWALDLRPGDVFWCTADPGWVTGTSYGIIAPLTIGATLVSDSGDFEPARWYGLLQDLAVDVWYTAPTALRMLMRAGDDLPHGYDLSRLRHIASVGEPLNPEVVVWGQETLGLPVHDNWWQTETGAIMISNYRCMPIRPGSMGRAVPGVEAVVLARGEDGRAFAVDGRATVLPEGEVGELALCPGWPSMFRGYLHDPARYDACFVGGWYTTGDLARRDADGYFWFVGRADDVIKTAGHLVGPFEVESALLEHPAVAEAGVIGKPDPVAGQIVKAFVTLRPDVEPSEELRDELVAFGRRRLGSVAPREIAFDAHLPHTRSGKIMRRLLKARELGLPEGDISSLEHQR